jgi:hypothetical protein
MSDNSNYADPFDPASLRIDPSAEEEVARRVIAHVAVRKPNPQEFFRVNASTDYRLPMGLLELKEEREFYAVTPALARELASEIR